MTKKKWLCDPIYIAVGVFHLNLFHLLISLLLFWILVFLFWIICCIKILKGLSFLIERSRKKLSKQEKGCNSMIKDWLIYSLNCIWTEKQTRKGVDETYPSCPTCCAVFAFNTNVHWSTLLSKRVTEIKLPFDCRFFLLLWIFLYHLCQNSYWWAKYTSKGVCNFDLAWLAK